MGNKILAFRSSPPLHLRVYALIHFVILLLFSPRSWVDVPPPI